MPNYEVRLYFVSQEDRYGLLQSDLGRLMPLKISLDAGKPLGVNLKKWVTNKLLSKGNCKPYTKGHSFMRCMLKHQMKCFHQGNKTCKCIPENNHRTHFKLYPSKWEVCMNDEDYECSTVKMMSCYLNKMVAKHCPLPCEKEEYKGQKINLNRWPGYPNSMLMHVKYSTTNIQLLEEYQVQDIYNFIGTVGGSLGLFIGFSYTGFIGNFVDYIFTFQQTKNSFIPLLLQQRKSFAKKQGKILP